MSLRFHQVQPEAEVCYPGASTVTRTVRLVKADCHKRLQQKDLGNAVHAASAPKRRGVRHGLAAPLCRTGVGTKANGSAGSEVKAVQSIANSATPIRYVNGPQEPGVCQGGFAQARKLHRACHLDAPGNGSTSAAAMRNNTE